MIALIVTGILVLARVGTLIAVLPVFSLLGMPRWAAPMVALMVSVAIATNLPPQPLPTGYAAILLAVGGEIGFGAALGLGVSAAFATLALGAEVMAMQSGYSFATMFDPLNRAQESVLGTFASWLAGLVFVTLGLHIECLQIVARSFDLVPPGTASIPHDAAGWAVAAVAGCLSLGVQLAAPVVSMVWLIHVWIALLSKLAPRMHAFFSVGTTLTGAVGVGMLAVSLPWLITIHAARMTDAVAELGRRIVGT